MRKSYLILAALAAYVSLGASAAQFGADRHVAKGVSCQMCHGQNMNMTDPEIPTIDTCVKCHPTSALVEKTKNVKPQNPHTSPHYQDKLDCTNCHLMHEEPVNFCDQCHQFGFKVP